MPIFLRTMQICFFLLTVQLRFGHGPSPPRHSLPIITPPLPWLKNTHDSAREHKKQTNNKHAWVSGCTPRHMSVSHLVLRATVDRMWWSASRKSTRCAYLSIITMFATPLLLSLHTLHMFVCCCWGLTLFIFFCIKAACCIPVLPSHFLIPLGWWSGKKWKKW